jgi:hypothetical protein
MGYGPIRIYADRNRVFRIPTKSNTQFCALGRWSNLVIGLEPYRVFFY